MNALRPILYGLLAIIVFTLWNDWQHRPIPHPPKAAPTTVIPSLPPAQVKRPIPKAPMAPRPKVRPQAARAVRVRTNVLIATLSTRGADPVRLVLRRYFAKHSHRKRLYPLLVPKGPAFFVNDNGLLARHAVPNQDTLYTIAKTHYRLRPGKNHLRLRFHWASQGLSVTKTYVFTRGSYVVGVRYHVTNLGPRPRQIYLYSQFLHGPPPKTPFYHSAPVYVGGAIYTPAHKYHQVPFPHLAKHPLSVHATGGWVAVSQHYFLGAALPPATTPAIFYSLGLPGPRYVLGYKTAHALTVAPHASGTLTTRLFLGPKKPSILRKVAPGLPLTVDYGWLTVLAKPLYWFLARIDHLTGNWGVAIILLTVLIKLIFYPLSAASFKSMAKMRKLQPRMAALKERHGSDRGALQQAMMELYRQEKMNPLGGCLPMIVQIPVFIALYWVLLDSVSLRDAPFILWIHNLAAPDPYFVLPILMGASMMLQQLLNPAMMDPTQRKIMMAMPVIFTVFFLFFPAGLVLYWVVNNLLSILQQWWVMARMEKA